MGKSICSFVGSELSFLKLVSVLVGLSGGVSNFSSKPAQPQLLLLSVLACRLELKWSQDKSIRKVLLDLCVLMMWSDWGWSFGEGANFYFS